MLKAGFLRCRENPKLCLDVYPPNAGPVCVDAKPSSTKYLPLHKVPTCVLADYFEELSHQHDFDSAHGGLWWLPVGGGPAVFGARNPGDSDGQANFFRRGHLQDMIGWELSVARGYDVYASRRPGKTNLQKVKRSKSRIVKRSKSRKSPKANKSTKP